MLAEAYLVKDLLFTFDRPKADAQHMRHIDISNLQNHYNLSPVDGSKESDVFLASKLETIFSEETEEIKKNLHLSLTTPPEHNGYFKVELISFIFRRFLLSLGDQIQLKLVLRNSEVEVPSVYPVNQVTTAIMNWHVLYGPIVFSGNTDNFPQRWAQYWNLPMKLKFSVRVSVIVCGNLVLNGLDSNLTEELHLDDDDKECISKKLLEEQIDTNITIITLDGSRIECHRNFLIAQSSVFQAMLTGGKYKEGESQQIKMADMSEKGIKALLAFLYYRGLEEPSKDLKVAIELLRAANKYDISSLEKAVATMIMRKPIEWFDIATTIQLFFFSKNVDQLFMVKFKSLQMLKANMAELTASNEFKQLFVDVDDVKRVAAMELSTALLNM